MIFFLEITQSYFLPNDFQNGINEISFHSYTNHIIMMTIFITISLRMLKNSIMSLAFSPILPMQMPNAIKKPIRPEITQWHKIIGVNPSEDRWDEQSQAWDNWDSWQIHICNSCVCHIKTLMILFKFQKMYPEHSCHSWTAGTFWWWTEALWWH